MRLTPGGRGSSSVDGIGDLDGAILRQQPLDFVQPVGRVPHEYQFARIRTKSAKHFVVAEVLDQCAFAGTQLYFSYVRLKLRRDQQYSCWIPIEFIEAIT